MRDEHENNLTSATENGRTDVSALGRIQTSDRESQLTKAVEAYLAELEVGQHPGREPFIARYPEIAEELRKCLDGLELIHRVGPQLSSTERSPTLAKGDPVKADNTLGDFRIICEIGRGGMGVVYEAEQISLPRRVAMKVLPFAAVLDPRQLERFKNEARAAATLDHPGIVSIFSVGCERGVHFFAMQFIEGQSLAEVIEELQHGGPLEQPNANMSASVLSGLTEEFLTENSGLVVPLAEKETIEGTLDDTDKHRTPASSSTGRSDASKDLTHKPTFFRFAARLGAQAAEALDHAHTRGILHRDVKPGNLMLDAEGKIHVADFGLARIEAEAGVTMTGDILGTLRYMSPEQALARRAVVDQRTDIYSLGATLYELITLTPLLEGRDRQELLRKIAFEEPQQPRKLNAAVPVDLETIVLKAIAKNPTDRYTTAQAMADDLYRFIDGKPVQARRINASQRLLRWSKRNPIVAVLTATVALLATLVAIVTSIGYARTSLALAQVSVKHQEAQQERDEAIRNAYVAQMRMAQKDWEDGQVGRLKQTLLSYLPAPGQPDLRGWEWYFHLSRCFGETKALHGHDFGQICSITWSPDGTSLASAQYHGYSGEHSEIKLWNLETGEAIETMPHRGIKGGLFAWHKGEQRLAWRVDDSETSMVVQHGESRVTIELDAKLNSVAWSPDGNRLASITEDKTLIIWDAVTGEEVRKLIGHNVEVNQLSWSPDGKQLAATGYEPGTITIWDVETGNITTTLESGQFNWCLAWSPDSTRLAVGTFFGNTLVWDVTSGEQVLALSNNGGVISIVWSPDGSRFALGLTGGNITLRDANSGKTLWTIRNDQGDLTLAWSPDGKQIASGGRLGIVKIWDVVQDQGVRLIADDAEHGGIAFSPDDRRLAYWALGQTITIRDVITGKEIQTMPGPEGDGLRPVWSPNGKHLACGGDDGSIAVYDLEKDEVRRWQHDGVKMPISENHRVITVAWHPDGRQLASVSRKERKARIWDIFTGEELSSFELDDPNGSQSVAWSPDGERLATSGEMTDGRSCVHIWDRVGWRKLHTIIDNARELGWSHDGRYLASGFGGSVTISDTFTGRVAQVLSGHTGFYLQIAGWSEDGRRIATNGQDGVRMWNPQTGQELLSLPNTKSMAWSHDRKRIATIEDGKVRIYDASIGYEIASTPSYRSQRAQILLDEADSLTLNGKYQQALQKLEMALSFAPENGQLQSQVAWRMLTLPKERFRDIAKAIATALRGTELSPETPWNWMVLGIAQYRSGEWKDAQNSLLKLVELHPDNEHPRTSCFLAMTCWQLGEKEAARQHYEDAVGWIEKNQNDDAITLGFRDEAAELLGIDIDAPNTKKGADKVTD